MRSLPSLWSVSKKKLTIHLLRLPQFVGAKRDNEATGCGHSMMSAAMAKHVKWKRSTASFNTAAGQYLTNHTATVLFTLPKFSESKIRHRV
jgi:hypothetical protein